MLPELVSKDWGSLLDVLSQRIVGTDKKHRF